MDRKHEVLSQIRHIELCSDSEPEKDGAEEERKKEKEESDMEMDEDRLEPRSDDDDT